MDSLPPFPKPSKWLLVPEYLRAFLFAAKAFTLDMANRRKRHFIQKLAEKGGYAPRAIRPTLEQIPFSSLRDPAIPSKVLEPYAEAGNVTCYELAILTTLVEKSGAKAIFEIGTFDGRTTLNLVACAGTDSRAWTLDLPAAEMAAHALPLVKGEERFIEKAVSGARFQGMPQAAQITQLLGDSATFDFTPWHGKMDFVFIDGSHAYEYVVSDTKNALKLLKSEGGMLVWHDYSEWPGVTHALNHISLLLSGGVKPQWVKGSTVVFASIPGIS